MCVICSSTCVHAAVMFKLRIHIHYIVLICTDSSEEFELHRIVIKDCMLIDLSEHPLGMYLALQLKNSP